MAHTLLRYVSKNKTKNDNRKQRQQNNNERGEETVESSFFGFMGEQSREK